jgi:hypothetical protein
MEEAQSNLQNFLPRVSIVKTGIQSLIIYGKKGRIFYILEQYYIYPLPSQ